MGGSRDGGLASVLAQESQVLAGAGVRGEVLNSRVSSLDPAISVLAVRLAIIQVHLDEVLVEAVVVGRPATIAVLERAVLGAHKGTNQTGPGLGATGGIEEVALCLCDELGILVVARQVAETSPLENEGTDLGNVVAASAAVARLRVEKDCRVGDTAGGVKGDGKTVGKGPGLIKKRLNLSRVGREVAIRAVEKVIRCVC